MVETVSVFEVEDFDRWKRAWDHALPVQRHGGILRHQIQYHPTDRNRFVVVRAFGDLDQARAYLASPARRLRMEAAGVMSCQDYLPEAENASR